MRYLPESPLGVLFAAGVFEPCHEGEGVWLDEGAVRARVVGIPYKPGGLDRQRLAAVKPAGETHLLVLLHISAAPKGGQFPDGEEIVAYQELVDLCPAATAFFVGHWHRDQGATQLGRTWIVNCGSLTRGSLAEDDLLRVPKIAVVDLGPGGGARVHLQEIRVAPPGSVFDLRGRDAHKSRAESEERAVRLAHLFDRLNQLAEGQSLEDQVRQMPEMRPAVRARVLDALSRGRQRVGDLAGRPE